MPVLERVTVTGYRYFHGVEHGCVFGDTMCLHDLDKGDVTPPVCAACVPIPANLAKPIEEEIQVSSGVLETSKRVLLARRNFLALA